MSPAFAVLAVLASVAGVQDPPRTVFRAETRVVYVDVLAERDGRAVPGLDAADFEILDDGEPQTAVLVDHERVPLSVVLTLDTSASVRGTKLRYLQSAARSILDALEPNDAAGVLTFSHHVSLRQGLTTERNALLRSVNAITPLGATAWHDALLSAISVVDGASGRPMVILFTDGDDTYSWLRDDEMLSLVEESNVLVYAVASHGEDERRIPDVRSSRLREQWRRGRVHHSHRTKLLRDLTEASGGRLLETRSTDQLEQAFLEILAESGSRYLLAFQPESPVRPGWHELEVKVKRRGIDVRARRGYYYEAHAPSQ